MAEFIDQGLNVAGGARAGDVGTEGSDHGTGEDFPMGISLPDFRAGEDQLEDISLRAIEGRVVGEDTGGGFVPADDVPGRSADESGTVFEGVEDGLKSWGDSVDRLVADVGEAAQSQEVKVFSFGFGQ